MHTAHRLKVYNCYTAHPVRQACPGPVALVAGAAGSYVDFLPGEPIRVAAVAGATQLAQVGPLTTREPTVLDLICRYREPHS